VKAYVATLNPHYPNLILTEVDNVPASTPVVLKGSYYNKSAKDLPAINIANDLQGTDADTEADGTMYVLAKVDDKVGFYKATGTIAAGKAYYQSASGVKAFYFDGDDATSINEELRMKNEKSETAIYDLQGRKVFNSQSSIINGQLRKGINIVNGKKILF